MRSLYTVHLVFDASEWTQDLRGVVLQSVAVCCSVLQSVAVWCSVLQCVAVCCMRSLYTMHLVFNASEWSQDLRGVVLQGAAVCCSVLQCVAVCCVRSLHTMHLVFNASE